MFGNKQKYFFYFIGFLFVFLAVATPKKGYALSFMVNSQPGPISTTNYFLVGTTTFSGTVNQIAGLWSYRQDYGGGGSYMVYLHRRDPDTGSYYDCISDAKSLSDLGAVPFSSAEDVAGFTGGAYGVFEGFHGTQCGFNANSSLSFYIVVNGNVVGGVGRTSAISINYHSGLSNAWFIVSGIGGTDLNSYNPVPPDDLSTHFISFNPVMGSSVAQATSTSFDIASYGYVSDSDFVDSDTWVYVRWRQATGMGKRDNPLTSDWGEETFSVIDPGNFSATTTSSILNTGVYNIYWEIRVPRWDFLGVSIGTKVLSSAIGSICVSDSVCEDSELLANQLVINTGLAVDSGMIDIVSGTTATSSEVLYDFISGGLGIRNMVMQKFPISWVVETIEVLNSLSTSTATTTTPLFSLTFATSTMIATSTPIIVNFITPTFFDDIAEVPAIQVMRTLLVWSMWISFAGVIMRKVPSIFNKNQTV
jgi:hypothetical protein